jgi:hypothetical protein
MRNNNMRNNRHLQRIGLITLLGASTAAVLSGCGGATVNSGGGAITNATPTVYGINSDTGSTGSGIEFPQTAASASGSTTTTAGGIVGALSSTAIPIEGAVPLGFPPGAYEADNATAGQAVPTSQPSVVFRALVANGNAGNAVSPITGVTLTSPEVSGFTQTLTFGSVGTGPAGSAGYATPPFTLPFTTSGVHQFTASVTDQGGKSSATVLGVVVVAPTDVALFVSSFDTGTTTQPPVTTPPTAPTEVFNTIAAGDTVTIDGGKGDGVYPTGYSINMPDANGNVVLFAAPGTHTVVETDPTGKIINSNTFTLPATAAGTTIYAVPAPAATTITSSVSKPHLVRKTSHVSKH